MAAVMDISSGTSHMTMDHQTSLLSFSPQTD
jgi:hypothetical protein